MSYKVLDICSYVPKDIIELEQIEELFVSGMENPDSLYNGYEVKRMGNDEKLDAKLVQELSDEGREVGVLKKDGKLIAIIGYRENV